jgi:hypothetical protein
MHQERGLKFCLNTRNNRALHLDPACPKCLSVRSPTGLHYQGPSVSFKDFFLCTQSEYNPENNLAKFGYILHKEVEKNQNLFYIVGFLLKVIIKPWWCGFIFIFQNLSNFGLIFFPWKILCVSWNHIYQVESLPIKRKATMPIQISISCFYTGY